MENSTELITPEEKDQLKIVCVTLTTISTVCCLPTLFTNLLVRSRWRFPYRITTSATAAVFIFNVNILAGWWANFYPVTHGGTFCVIQGVVFHLSILALVFYWLVIALLVNAVVVEQLDSRSHQQREIWYHFFVVLGCAVFTVPPIVGAAFGQTPFFWCWIEDANTGELGNSAIRWQIGCLYGPMALVLVAAGVALAPVIRILYAHATTSASTNAFHGDDHTMREHLIRYLLFIVVFALSYATVLGTAIERAVVSKNDTSYDAFSNYLATEVAACCIGMYILLLFGITRDNRRIWRKWITGRCIMSGSTAADDAPDVSPLIDSAAGNQIPDTDYKAHRQLGEHKIDNPDLSDQLLHRGQPNNETI